MAPLPTYPNSFSTLSSTSCSGVMNTNARSCQRGTVSAMLLLRVRECCQVYKSRSGFCYVLPYLGYNVIYVVYLCWLLSIYVDYCLFMLIIVYLCWLLSIYVDYCLFMLIIVYLCWLLSIYVDYCLIMLIIVYLCWLLSIYVDYCLIMLIIVYLCWLLSIYVDYWRISKWRG